MEGICAAMEPRDRSFGWVVGAPSGYHDDCAVALALAAKNVGPVDQKFEIIFV